MLNAVLNELNNFFFRFSSNIINTSFLRPNLNIQFQFSIDATFTAPDTITGDFTDTYLVGEYIKINDSRLNDGVYLITAIDNSSITIDTTVDFLIKTEPEIQCLFTKLFIPSDVVQLIDDINTFNTSVSNGVSSESQGNRSITYSTGSNGSTGWVQAFNSRLSVYRKLRWCR